MRRLETASQSNHELRPDSPHHAAAGMPLRARDPAVGHSLISPYWLRLCPHVSESHPDPTVQDRARVETCFANSTFSTSTREAEGRAASLALRPLCSSCLFLPWPCPASFSSPKALNRTCGLQTRRLCLVATEQCLPALASDSVDRAVRWACCLATMKMAVTASMWDMER
jgi:hypothetical protein